MMLLHLSICKFENLKTFLQSRLSCLSLAEVIHNTLVRIRLLNVTVAEIDNGVAVWVRLSPHLVREDYFLLSVQVHSLDLAVCSGYLIGHRDI